MAVRGSPREDACLCEILWFDPLVLTLDGSPVHLTDAAGGVGFDLTGDGLGEWVARGGGGPRRRAGGVRARRARSAALLVLALRNRC